MKKAEIYETILKCADENGIYVLIGDELPEDVDLMENISESLQFMSFILELEQHLGIEIPDEYLIYDSLTSVAAFSETLESLFDE